MVLSQLVFNPFVMASLNKFRSKISLTSPILTCMDSTLCAIIVFNMLFECLNTSFLYPTHSIICKVPQLSSEFQKQIQPQRPVGFPMPRKERHLLVDG
jgi:hypothetical protein